MHRITKRMTVWIKSQICRERVSLVLDDRGASSAQVQLTKVARSPPAMTLRGSQVSYAFQSGIGNVDSLDSDANGEEEASGEHRHSREGIDGSRAS